MGYVGDLLGKLLSIIPAIVRMRAVPDVKNALERMQSLGGKYLEVYDNYIYDLDRALQHTWRGLTDNMHLITEGIPFSLQELGEKLALRGVRLGITTAPDDTTNPPVMQQWFHAQIPGSNLLHFDRGWGHLHLLTPANFERCI